MRRSSIFALAAGLALAIPASAKPQWVQPAKNATNRSDITCKSCHDGPTKSAAAGGQFTDMGKWLLAHKTNGAVDPAALKGYKGK